MGELKRRVKNFMNEFGTPATVFARNVQISVTTYHAWMRGSLKLSALTEKRIENYLIKYGF